MDTKIGLAVINFTEFTGLIFPRGPFVFNEDGYHQRLLRLPLNKRESATYFRNEASSSRLMRRPTPPLSSECYSENTDISIAYTCYF